MQYQNGVERFLAYYKVDSSRRQRLVQLNKVAKSLGLKDVTELDSEDNMPTPEELYEALQKSGTKSTGESYIINCMEAYATYLDKNDRGYDELDNFVRSLQDKRQYEMEKKKEHSPKRVIKWQTLVEEGEKLLNEPITSHMLHKEYIARFVFIMLSLVAGTRQQELLDTVYGDIEDPENPPSDRNVLDLNKGLLYTGASQKSTMHSDRLNPIPKRVVEWIKNNRRSTGYVLTKATSNEPETTSQISLAVSEFTLARLGEKLTPKQFRESRETYTVVPLVEEGKYLEADKIASKSCGHTAKTALSTYVSTNICDVPKSTPLTPDLVPTPPAVPALIEVPIRRLVPRCKAPSNLAFLHGKRFVATEESIVIDDLTSDEVFRVMSVIEIRGKNYTVTPDNNLIIKGLSHAELKILFLAIIDRS